METTATRSLHHSLASKPPLLTIINPHKFSQISPNQIFFSPLRHHQSIKLVKPINGSDSDSSSSSESAAPETVEIRFRRRSRRRSKLESEDGELGNGRPKKAELEIPKKWEEMSFGEKAMEIYVGEKGLLFWLNKFAYASIFIVIGGWILFRFVGPSLNLYQLDTPPLSPTSIFKG